MLKQMKLPTDILEYDGKAPEPMFVLIIGTKSMEEFGIILDFVSKEITIDQMKLPMQTLKRIKNPKRRFLIYKQVYYNEPIAIEEISKQKIRILDAKYEKANLSQIVNEKCKQLTSVQ